ncbi:MAG: flagellar hook-basal body complex protein FliE [Verrucomicrobiota bacterium]
MSPISAMPSAMSGLDLISTRAPRIAPAEVQPFGSPSEISTVQPSGDSFAGMLGKMVSDVNAKQMAAGQTVSALQAGQNVPLHQAVIAMEEANVSFQLMVEVRNKLLESYQEIMRMQI